MPRQELALGVKLKLIQMLGGGGMYTHHEVNLVSQIYVQSLEVIEAGLDTFKWRLCRKLL
jgi:hypothetical protein